MDDHLNPTSGSLWLKKKKKYSVWSIDLRINSNHHIADEILLKIRSSAFEKWKKVIWNEGLISEPTRLAFAQSHFHFISLKKDWAETGDGYCRGWRLWYWTPFLYATYGVMIGPGKQALSEHGLGLRLTWSMNAVWAAEAQYLLGTFCLWDIY